MRYKAAVQNIKATALVVLSGILAVSIGLGMPGRASAAACTAPSTDYGSATTSLTISSAATYRIWTRMMAPDTTNNTYLLEIDGNTCYNVGGGSIPTNTWTWVAYQGGSATNYVQQSLSQGTHTLKLIGNAPGVELDRIVALSDTSCVPTGFGDNCNVPDDTTAPTVTMTAPTDGATVSGQTTISATASDNVAVSKVEFYDNSTLLATDTTAPYSTSWNSTTASNGSHLVSVRAYDAAGNVSSDSATVTVQNGDAQAPTTPTNLTATATAYNTAKLTWSASTDNIGVTGYTIYRDGVPVAKVGTTTSYSDTALSPSTTYSYGVSAFDAAGNTSAESATVQVTTPAVPDTQAPTAPTGLSATAVSSSQINLTWTPSTDNIGVTKYNIYRIKGTKGSGQLVGSSTTPAFGDANLSARTNYTYYVVALDAAGNKSPASAKVTAKTLSASSTRTGTTSTGSSGGSSGLSSGTTQSTLLVSGTVTGSDGKVVGHGQVVTVVGGHRYAYQLDEEGRYAIYDLGTGRYSLTVQARGYNSKTVSVRLKGHAITENIKLHKR